jgi:hypothetical protein
MPKPYCERRQSLFTEFQEAMATYSKAVGELTAHVTSEEYVKLQKNAEIARELTVVTRSALDRHIQEHGC